MANETKVKIAKLEVSSPSFKNEEDIPLQFTCDGKNINPSISVKQVPPEAKSLVLLVDDPDAPSGTFTHWLVFNIAPDINIIEENSIPGTEGENSSGEVNYYGPCPPEGGHRYFFKVYALDSKLDLNTGANQESVENAMKDHLLASGAVMGIYRRNIS